ISNPATDRAWRRSDRPGGTDGARAARAHGGASTGIPGLLPSSIESTAAGERGPRRAELTIASDKHQRRERADDFAHGGANPCARCGRGRVLRHGRDREPAQADLPPLRRREGDLQSAWFANTSFTVSV